MKERNNIKLSVTLSLTVGAVLIVAGFGPEWLLDNISGYLLAASLAGSVIQVVFIFSTSRFWKIVPIAGLIFAILSAAYYSFVMQLTGLGG